MSVSVEGFIADRQCAFGWTAPSEEQFRFHIAQTRQLGGHLCGRRLYETMLPWETDPSMRDNELGNVFADVWCAISKVVFSRTLDSVQGNARLAKASVAEEAAAALDATDKDVSIGGAALTDSDEPAAWLPPDGPVRALGCASWRVRPTGPGVGGRVGRAGSPPSTPTWSTPWEVTPQTPDPLAKTISAAAW